MVAFRFDREFRHWVRKARANCVLCKAMHLIIYRPGTTEVDEETAAAAAQAGVGAPLENFGGQGTP